MTNLILSFLSKPRNVLLIIIVAVVVGLGMKYVQAQNQIAELERLRNVDAQTIASQTQELEQVLSYTDSLEKRIVVLEAPVPLDKEAARAFVHQEILDELDERGAVLIGGMEIQIKLPDEEGSGSVDVDTVDVDPDDSENKTLNFSIEEDTELAKLSMQLQIKPLLESLEYQFQLVPKMTAFRFYTVQDKLEDGRPIIQVWADVPGDVLKLDSFIVDDLIGQSPNKDNSSKRQFFIGATGYANTRGEYSAGPEVGFTRDLWKLTSTAGVGYDLISKDTMFGHLSLRLRF